MLNILPNVWVNEDAIESLHFEKNALSGDKLHIYMVSGKVYNLYEKINEIMRDIEKYFNRDMHIPKVDTKPKPKRAYRKKVKVEEEKPNEEQTKE